MHNTGTKENIVVSKPYLTIRSENGSANCIVNALNSNDHVFDVQQNYVNISGFTVENATGNQEAGIYLNSTQHCNISSNDVTNNDDGIYLHSSSNNTLTNNPANSNNNFGIYLHSSSNNTLTENTASNNYYGIYLYHSSNNLLYHNSLINNTNNAHDTGTNQWNTSIVGNYYSDYTGSDNDSDGIGDTSYQIPGGSNIDYFPLMHPWGKPPLKCDLGGDSQITSTDAAIALQIAVGSRQFDDAVDVSGDGKVTSLDALMIMQAVAEGTEL
ncbi:MAG: hypothetical protein EF812_04060 [Methanosarcinales archaeon]|nr:MAG: hypothetical protein EF812_04060 [Methanosarcinales archaeon]